MISFELFAIKFFLHQNVSFLSLSKVDRNQSIMGREYNKPQLADKSSKKPQYNENMWESNVYNLSPHDWHLLGKGRFVETLVCLQIANTKYH